MKIIRIFSRKNHYYSVCLILENRQKRRIPIFRNQPVFLEIILTFQAIMTKIEKPLKLRGFSCLFSGENLPAIEGILSRTGFYLTRTIRFTSENSPAIIL